MSTATARHTCMVSAERLNDATKSRIRWWISIVPERETNPGAGHVSFQMVLELVEPEADTQLDFEF